MSKIIVTLSIALALAGAACSTANTATPMGCVASRPDAGTPDAVCAVEWACSSDSQHYDIVCTQDGSNWSCACTSDTVTGTNTIVINSFSCNLTGGSLTAAAKCGWYLQM